MILAIDPGPIKSAAVVWEGSRIVSMSMPETPDELMRLARNFAWATAGYGVMAVERVGMAMRVGMETFDTAMNVGRLIECWKSIGRPDDSLVLVHRKSVVTHLCGTSRAGDKDVRYALVQRFGNPAEKKQSGLLRGVTTHLWSALAVAVYTSDTQAAREKGWVA